MRKVKSDKNRVATLSDVARAANVSTATVSRCLNLPEQVEEKTRARVMEAVEALSYSPNFGAKIMAARRTNTVGAVIPTMENSIFARGIQAFQEALNHHGYTLLVASSSYQPEVEEEQIKNLIERGAEALLLIGYDRDDRIYRFLDNRGLPYVLTWVYDEERAFDEARPHHSIGFDNHTAMEEMAERVIEVGHQHIGAIVGETRANDRSRERLEGIKSAMARHGLDQHCLKICEMPYSLESGAEGFEKLMTAHPELSVVMCGNDVLATGALMKARAMGMTVPHDISITGFDDIDLAEVVEPPLTTVHVPHRKMGLNAAEMLIDWINKGESPPSQKLETYICTRGTLDVPRSAPRG